MSTSTRHAFVSESVVIVYRCPRCKWSGREVDTNYGRNGWGRYCPRCPKAQHCYPTQDAAISAKEKE